MLATYSLGKPQDAHHMLFVTVYVGNLQPGKTPGCLSYAVRNRVCWQPTAWKPLRCQLYGFHSRVRWQPTRTAWEAAWEAAKMPSV